MDRGNGREGKKVHRPSSTSAPEKSFGRSTAGMAGMQAAGIWHFANAHHASSQQFSAKQQHDLTTTFSHPTQLQLYRHHGVINSTQQIFARTRILAGDTTATLTILL